MLRDQSPLLLALLGGLFTWGVTALGASMVFFFKTINRRVLDTMLGFAGGVMIAAAFWSLLLPAVEMTTPGTPSWLPVTIGFLAGGAFLYLADKVTPHLHITPGATPEGISTHLKRSILMIFAITLHNIPEGLSFGVAFGSMGIDPGQFAAAATLALGIGLQNFPEGAAVAIPLRREGMSRWKSFLIGQASGIVEPIAAVLGAMLALSMRSLLPYALSFAAGAMIFVVVEEMIPESQEVNHKHLSTIGTMVGFALMTFLDVALG